jgi:ribosomal protein S18 acetylase RimI-like enzyme
MDFLQRRQEMLIRQVEHRDLNDLVSLEENSFTGDRINRRRFQHWIKANNRVFTVVELDGRLVAYGLVLLRRNSRLARLYSIAVSVAARGQGIGRALLLALEKGSVERGRLDMRLEVASSNHGAIKLYESLGYRIFGEYPDYYSDHGDALRMQKHIACKDPASI